VRWAWRSAGVPTIVLPRWATDDTHTSAVLKEFYARMKGGDQPEVAMQGARATVRSSDETRAPYFWAGWIVVGR